MPTSLKEFAEAEAHNLDSSTKALGNSAELVNDFESVYEVLFPLLKQPEGDLDSDQVLAFVSVIHEFAFCRTLLSKSALALMRGYQGDSMLHLRRAIEACAFAVRMNKHRELA